MQNKFSKKLIIFSAVLVFGMACVVPGLATPAPSNVELLPIETIIAGTAAAAQTQTAIFLPPPTDTLPPTVAVQETATETEAPSPTATIIFIIPTATKPFVPGSAGSGCDLVAVTPYHPVLAPGKNFDTTWTLKNTGDAVWLEQNMDFRYTSGTDMHKKDAYDLPSSVPPTGEISITVAMIAPSKAGEYTTTWVLAAKKQTICKVSTTVVVK